jgi:pullulanase
MGIFDLKTMQEIRTELTKIDPGLFLYGEGWAADKSPLPENERAVKRNISKLPGIACFNDDFRDAIRGNHGNKKSNGFVSGLVLKEEAVKFGITGAVFHPQIEYGYIDSVPFAWATEPDQCINYVSCHDNYTLWDKLKQTLPKASDEDLRARVKLAGALVLTSQGVPFLHSGVEFCRTKGGNGNSYKSADSVNQLDWYRKKEFFDVFEYYQNLIELRKNHPAFRISNADQIRRDLDFCTHYNIGVVSYCINGKSVGDSWGKIILIFNGNTEEVTIPLPVGNYKIVAHNGVIDEDGIDSDISEEIVVAPVSMSIAVLID